MSRVAIDLGIIQIYWYSIMIALGLLVGISLILMEAKRQKMSEDDFVNLVFGIVLWGIIGARLYYVLFNFEQYSGNLFEILEIWNGGLAIHGALLFGGIFSIYYTKKQNMDFAKSMDIVAVGVIAGQMIGRWGNFFNQEAYGSVVSLEFLQGLHLPEFIIEGMKIGANYHHPTFLYESIWCFIGLIILLLVRRYRYIHTGQIAATYFIWYGIGRFMIEGLRTDSLMLGSFKVAQLVSAITIVAGIIVFVIKQRKSRFDCQYNIREESDVEMNAKEIK